MNALRGWHTAVADVVVFGVAFGVANIVSYVYIVIAGRTLQPVQFGVFNALLGVIAISAFLAGSLQLATTQAAAGASSRQALAELARRSVRVALPAVTLLTLAAMPLASTIGATATDVVLCGISILLIFLAATPMGFLGGIVGPGGNVGIRAQAAINLLGAIARLGIGWPLMAFGMGVGAGVLGYAGSCAAVLVLAWCACGYLEADPFAAKPGIIPLPRIEAPSVAAFVLAFAPFSLDQLLVQAFAPALGGDYAGLATVTKPVFYGAYPLLAVAYPHLLRQSAERSGLRVAGITAAGVAGIALCLAAAMAAFPVQLTELFFAGRFQAIAAYVGPMAAGIACFSLSVTGVHVLIAQGARIGWLPSLVALTAGVVLFALRHDSLTAVVSNQLWVYALQFALMAVAVSASLWRTRRDRHSAMVAAKP